MSPNTTLTSYTRDAFHRRNEEMLANGMQQLDRKYLSDGRIDAAGRHRLRADLGSATPGFACLDPYSSPFEKSDAAKDDQPNERSKGRLCQAYGKCPMCPLAMIDPSSPESYAYLYKLREALEEARGRLGATWIARWAQVSEKLTTLWARLFVDEDVVRKGIELAMFTFPNLPRLD